MNSISELGYIFLKLESGELKYLRFLLLHFTMNWRDSNDRNIEPSPRSEILEILFTSFFHTNVTRTAVSWRNMKTLKPVCG